MDEAIPLTVLGVALLWVGWRLLRPRSWRKTLGDRSECQIQSECKNSLLGMKPKAE